MNNTIVITWSAMDGSEPTDRTEFRDGCHRTVYTTCRKARAVVWSRTINDHFMASAKAHAAEVSGTVHVLPDTDDVLDKAREMELASPQHKEAHA
jgi:hypothetical protein